MKRAGNLGLFRVEHPPHTLFGDTFEKEVEGVDVDVPDDIEARLQVKQWGKILDSLAFPQTFQVKPHPTKKRRLNLSLYAAEKLDGLPGDSLHFLMLPTVTAEIPRVRPGDSPPGLRLPFAVLAAVPPAYGNEPSQHVALRHVCQHILQPKVRVVVEFLDDWPGENLGKPYGNREKHTCKYMSFDKTRKLKGIYGDSLTLALLEQMGWPLGVPLGG